MKKYIRTRDNKFYDITKEKCYIDNYIREQVLTEAQDFICWVDDIICESDNILDLIQVGDLVGKPIECINKSLLDLIKDRKENYNLKTPEELSIYELYTKQGDNYKLVWDKSRGVI